MINIAIMGFGTIGKGVAEILSANNDIIEKKCGNKVNLKRILDVRDIDDKKYSALLTRNFEDIESDPEIDIVVETIGGTKFSYGYTKRLLCAKKSVVTSNKELVSIHGAELLAYAAENKVRYMFEASVGGGIPVITPMIDSLAANEITEIHGIINGTTNYILTNMKKGKSFDEALADAQNKGYAELNPAADVDGHDACRKICILAALAFGKMVSPENVKIRGIRDITLKDFNNIDNRTHSLKLIASAVKLDSGEIYINVEPYAVVNTNPLAHIEGVYNGILIRGNAVGDVMFYGSGAGMFPTASAVMADIIHIASHGGKQHEQITWEYAPELYTPNLPDAISQRLRETLGCEAQEGCKARRGAAPHPASL